MSLAYTRLIESVEYLPHIEIAEELSFALRTQKFSNQERMSIQAKLYHAQAAVQAVKAAQYEATAERKQSAWLESLDGSQQGAREQIFYTLKTASISKIKALLTGNAKDDQAIINYMERERPTEWAQRNNRVKAAHRY